MDILNKSYKRKNSTDSDIFTVDKFDGEYVIFTNGARCMTVTLMTDFEEVSGTVNENVNSEPAVNPETFFNTPIVDENLMQQMESIVKNPNTNIQPSAKMQESVSLNDDNRQYEKVSPGGNNNFANRLSTDENMPETSSVENNNQPKSNRLPEWDVFDNVKLSEEIEILIPFKIKLPKAEKIDLLNDMFKTSFTAYLSKKYINDNIVKNSIKLQTTFQKSIEEWMDSELGSGTKKRKPVRKGKTSVVETVVETEDVQVKITEPVTAMPTENAASFFGRGNAGPTWDGDVKKLFTISTEEQYHAVKKKFINMKDNDVKGPDVDRFEDMLQMYEEQTK